LSKYDGDEKSIDDLQISKVALQIITKQIKKGIKGKEIEKIKKKDFELIANYKDKLDELNSEFKSPNNIKTLKQFVKEVCTIDKKGEVFKVMMKL
jgi:uncharacterized protein YutD